MNPNDPFEDELRQQALRPIPPAWKQSLLPGLPAPKAEPAPALSQLWKFLFYPHRYAYASLALLWVIIALLHADTPVSIAVSELTASQQPPTESETLALWQEKQRYLMVARSNPAALEYLIR